MIGGITERSRVRTGFAEVALVRTDASPTWRSASWVLGAALDAEGFRAYDVSRFDRTTATPGAFVQYDRPFTPWLRTSTSIRLDYSNLVGTILSPRLSALVRVGPHWSARLSGGHRLRSAHGSFGGDRGHRTQSGGTAGRAGA